MRFTAAARLFGCLLLLARGWPVGAAVPDEDSNPYSVISERNVFHLNPIPPPPPAPVAKVELPEIKLSGFLRVGKATHALFSYTPKDKKVEPIYYDLANGEKDGIVEVVRIHEDKGEVEIIDSGTPQTLSLKNDTIKQTASNQAAGPVAPRGSQFRGFPDHQPSRPDYRFPALGQNDRPGSSPGFAIPERHPRIQFRQ